MIYKKYEMVKLWFYHIAKIQGRIDNAAKEYTNWQRARQDFEKALKEKCGAPQLRELAIAIKAEEQRIRATPKDELLFRRSIPDTATRLELESG